MNRQSLSPIASAWLLLVAVAAAQPGYQATVVDAFNAGQVTYPELTFTDINDQGRAIGTSTYGSSYTGFWWTAATGKVQSLRYKAINGASDVIGSSVVNNLDTPLSLPIQPLNGSLASARDINDQRVVVGSAGLNFSQFAFVWDPVTGTRGIPVPLGRNLVRVNNYNVAIGHIKVSSSSSLTEAFVLSIDTGSWTNLSSLMPPQPLQSTPKSEVFDINDYGFVIGEGWNGTTSAAFRWHPQTGFVWLPGLDGGDQMRVHPYGINDANQVVGGAMNGAGEWRAFIWDDQNGMRDLNAITSGLPSGFVMKNADRINDQGQIVGYGFAGNWNPPRGVALEPQTCQQDMGFQGPGQVTLAMCGAPLASGASNDLVLRGAPVNVPGYFFVSTMIAPYPVAGGILATNPALLILPFTTSAQGDHVVPLSGGGGPADIYVQALVLDVSLPAQVGFSNALQLSFLP